MSLDQNLFTLTLSPNKDDPNITDLVDPSDNPHYRKERVPGNVYQMNVYDPLSQSLLATATAPNATSKHKTIELHNPSQIVELKYTGTLTFKWRFQWEQHEFEWKREECYILRKPDPAVLVALTKEPSGRIKTSSVQILDYNLNRQDAPLLPPRPPPKTGIERITELHMLKTLQGEGEANEIEVGLEGSADDYAQYVQRLLEGNGMEFITIRSASASEVPKVLQVVEHTKRLRHKAGLDEEQELYQYVLYNTDKAKGPRRINLDDRAPTKEYTPPTSLKIHLSKIPVPELRPKAEITPTKSRVPSSSSRPPALLPDKSKERGNGTKEPKFDRAKEHEKERLRLFEQAREEREKAEKAKGKDKKDKRSDKVKERERLKEEEKERQREKEAEKEREKARKIAEKEAKRKDKDKDKDKKGSTSHPDASKLSRPAHPGKDRPTSYYEPLRPDAYRPSPSPSFPQPNSSFHGGYSLPTAGVSVHYLPPPVHTSTRPRPTSFYGSGPGYNSMPVGGGAGYSPGYLR
ncbi:hypothetical protein EW026_g7917 [Hermanssonia centrifuga]|uniref:Uncharacterized protein n=1 Tax=Hermanssonia centrifuga TaxID=98765 RepID=A0A4S4K695_9APHY|nr:hypothetical protein EW026_g7917 [Hermanssonia centrifuga]